MRRGAGWLGLHASMQPLQTLLNRFVDSEVSSVTGPPGPAGVAGPPWAWAGTSRTQRRQSPTMPTTLYGQWSRDDPAGGNEEGC